MSRKPLKNLVFALFFTSVALPLATSFAQGQMSKKIPGLKFLYDDKNELTPLFEDDRFSLGSSPRVTGLCINAQKSTYKQIVKNGKNDPEYVPIYTPIFSWEDNMPTSEDKKPFTSFGELLNGVERVMPVGYIKKGTRIAWSQKLTKKLFQEARGIEESQTSIKIKTEGDGDTKNLKQDVIIWDDTSTEEMRIVVVCDPSSKKSDQVLTFFHAQLESPTGEDFVPFEFFYINSQAITTYGANW